LEFRVKNCVAWAGELTSDADWRGFANGEKMLADVTLAPALKQIPAMQRRRLSPFAKMALHCALEASGDVASSVPSVFSSRHGDLHKTSKLIADVADNAPLSPTQFGLSVHNAVGGQFSIYTKNKAPLTAISAGEDTFLMAIADAVCKLNSNDYGSILVVYTEEVVPLKYEKYIQQRQVSIGIALLLEKAQSSEPSIQLNVAANAVNEYENTTLQALDFLTFYHGSQDQQTISSKRHIWTLSKSQLRS